MKFQSEKKELWRYASKNLITPVRGMTRQPPLPHRLPLQRHPQGSYHQRQEEEQQCLLSQYPQISCCGDSGENSTSMSMRPQVSTPPPPYSSVAELDCSMVAQQQGFSTEGETETSLSTTETSLSETASYGRRPTRSTNNGGYNYVNTGDIMYVDDYEKLNENSSDSNSSGYHLTKKVERMPNQRLSISRAGASAPTTNFAPAPSTTVSSATASFAATAAKILRNCCGASFGSTNSVAAVPTTSPHASVNNNNTTCNKRNYESSKKQSVDASNFQAEVYFNALMKQLKARQISSLLKAVKSRHDPVITSSMGGASSSGRSSMTTYHTNCILMRRAEILGEEPYVIVCRLFLWRDLSNSSQLKRLPVCPNERDPVYVCCNPLHWCRILETAACCE